MRWIVHGKQREGGTLAPAEVFRKAGSAQAMPAPQPSADHVYMPVLRGHKQARIAEERSRPPLVNTFGITAADWQVEIQMGAPVM